MSLLGRMAISTWKFESQQHEYFLLFVALNARVDPGLERGGGWHSARARSLPPVSRRYELQSQCHMWVDFDGFLVWFVKYIPR